LRREGADVFIEVGPGKVLSGLMRQIDRSTQVWSASDVPSVNEVAGAVQPMLRRQ
jgi:[acyl-carrier-protein] S-malonyltransferase